MARKRKRDFVGDVRSWSDQSSYTRSWSRSPATGAHGWRLRGAARALPRLLIYLVIGAVGISIAGALLDAWLR